MVQNPDDLFYCCTVWGQNSSILINRIAILQKKAIRILSFAPPFSHSSPLFARLGILKFNDLIHLQNVLLLKDIYHNLSPVSLIKTFNIDFTHTYNTRGKSGGLVNLLSVNTKSFGSKSIRFQAIKSWNYMQNNYVILKFLDVHRNKLKHDLANLILKSY